MDSAKGEGVDSEQALTAIHPINHISDREESQARN